MDNIQILSTKEVTSKEKDTKLALKELYFEFYQDLYLYGLKLSGSKEIAKDCIQDLFIQFWSDFDQLNRVVSKKAYLLKCLRRRIFSFLAKEKKFSFLDDSLGQHVLTVSSVEENYFKIESENVLEQKLNKARAELSIRQQEVLYLRYSLNYPFSVICDIMDIKYQSVRNLLSESIKLLRTKFESEVPFQ